MPAATVATGYDKFLPASHRRGIRPWSGPRATAALLLGGPRPAGAALDRQPILPAPGLGRLLALQPAPAGQPARRERSRLDRGPDRAAGLDRVPAVTEAAPRGQRRHVGEGPVEALVSGDQSDRAYPRGVEQHAS